jgi:CRISPR system Cascade subunit CasD
MNSIQLRLQGPLQAWGVDGAAHIRRTRNAPHKRAVLGLIRAAKGLSRDQSWPELENLEYHCVAIKTPHRMWDFATMQNVTSADGTYNHPQGIQEREYLADGVFLVELTGNESVLREVAEALEDPVFLLGLGRRDCIPSHPILCHNVQAATLKDAV